MNVLWEAAIGLLLIFIGIAATSVVEYTVSTAAQTGMFTVSARPLRDLLRQLTYRDAAHKRIDHVLFIGAAPLALSAVSISILIIPFISRQSVSSPHLFSGVFFYLVILDFVAVALFMAGWGANHPAGTNGAFMAAAQLVSYIVPLGFAVTGVVMAAQSLAASEVVSAQRNIWFGLWQPFGFFIYLISAFGQTYRPPVDLPFAGESFALIEHDGPTAVILKVALYGIWFTAAAMGAVLFLGGGHGPLLPEVVWLFLKTMVLIAAMTWIGVRVRRLTMNELIRGAWMILIPASIVNVIIVGAILMVMP